MESRINEFDVDTIIMASDEMFRPYILLLDIDGNKYWRPYGGESIEDIHRFHKWEIEAQRHFKDKARSQDEIDYFRNAMLSIGLLTDLLSLNQDKEESIASQLVESAVFAIAMRWYCKDKGLDHRKFVPSSETEEDMNVYYQLAMFYANSFANTIQLVKDNIPSNS
jgi:hypothetical protein